MGKGSISVRNSILEIAESLMEPDQSIVLFKLTDLRTGHCPSGTTQFLEFSAALICANECLFL